MRACAERTLSVPVRHTRLGLRYAASRSPGNDVVQRCGAEGGLRLSARSPVWPESGNARVERLSGARRRHRCRPLRVCGSSCRFDVPGDSAELREDAGRRFGQVEVAGLEMDAWWRNEVGLR